jgi:TPR repeat protein
MKGQNIEPAAAWRLLCKAANQGYKEAQIEIGYWHNESSWERAQSDRIAWLKNAGIDADNRVAYMWYTLAAKGDLDRLRIINNMFSGELTEEEAAKAKDMARNWKPGQCPSPYQKYD